MPVSSVCRKPSVLLADDHTLFNDALRKLLEPEFAIVGAVLNGRALLEEAPILRPDVIILDLSMPLLSGTEAGHRIKATLPNTKIIVLTGLEDPGLAVQTLRNWASGFLLKKDAGEELIQAIRQVLRGAKYVAPSLREKLQDPCAPDYIPHPEKQLTSRQREVLQLLVEGYSMKQTAGILAVAASTVAFHKYKMMAELGLKTNADLMRLAIREHLMQ